MTTRNTGFLVTHTPDTVPQAMVTVTYLPLFVTVLFRGMPGIWKSRHRLILCWLVFMQALLPRAENLGRAGPLDPGPGDRLALSSRAEGGLLGYPSAGGMVGPGSPEHLAPAQGWHLYLVGDGSHKPEAGPTEPAGPKRTEKRTSALVFRDSLCPVDCQLGRVSLARGVSSDPTEKPSSLSTGKCPVSCHGERFVPPTWAKRIIVEGDAAYGSQDEYADGPEARCRDPARRWGFVFAIARTWKTVEDKAIKDLVTHLPRKYYQRVRVPRLPGRKAAKPSGCIAHACVCGTSATSRWC